MNDLAPLTHDSIDFSMLDLKSDETLIRFQGFLHELGAILCGPKEIIDSSYSRMGLINDEILEFAKRVEIEILRINKTASSDIEKLYAKILSSNEVKMAFDVIMKDFVDRKNFMPEKVKGDIDDTIGKLRNFLKHTIRDLVGARMDIPREQYSKLYVRLFFSSLAKEMKRTEELLDLIASIQEKFRKFNLTPEIFEKMRMVFEKVKLIAPEQWVRVRNVLQSIERFFKSNCMNKKHLMRATDFFELNKKMQTFSSLSKNLIEDFEELQKRPQLYAISDVQGLIDCTREFEGVLLDLGSFLEFVTYEVKKRECLSYRDDFLSESCR